MCARMGEGDLEDVEGVSHGAAHVIQSLDHGVVGQQLFAGCHLLFVCVRV